MKQSGPKAPVVLVKWYDYAKWLLERVENFPKCQRFVLGQRLTEQAMDVLVEASYVRDKAEILATANPQDGSPALDRLHGQGPQALHRRALNKCGRMVDGWLESRGGGFQPPSLG